MFTKHDTYIIFNAEELVSESYWNTASLQTWQNLFISLIKYSVA